MRPRQYRNRRSRSCPPRPAAAYRGDVAKNQPGSARPRSQADRDRPRPAVNYVEAGPGPVLLLIHGMAGNAENWRAVVEPLALATRVAPDLPATASRSPAAATTRSGSLATGLRDLLSPSATIARPWSATPSAAASRCSSPTSSRSWSNGWCSSPAAASAPGQHGLARGGAARRRPLHLCHRRPRAAGRFGCSTRPWRDRAATSADVAEVARGYASLADADRRKPSSRPCARSSAPAASVSPPATASTWPNRCRS